MRVRGPLKFFTMLILGGVLLWVLASTAAGQVTGPCVGTLNGADAGSISTPGTALEVPHDSNVTVSYTSSGDITGHRVQLAFAGIPWTVDEGDDDGDSWSSSVAVADYSRYGVGIYKVDSDTYGDSNCTGSAFIKVTGKNPLTTVAGAAGAAATGIGVIGTAAATVSSARKPRKPDFLDGVMNDVERVRLKESESDDGLIDFEKKIDRLADTNCFGCWYVLPQAMFQTMAFMIVGAGGVGAPLTVIRWRPFVSLAALGFSLLTGLGTLVLAQQYALVYPSLAVTIIWLVVALALGVALPSLGRLMGVRKANAIVAERLSQLRAGATPPPPAPQPTAVTPVVAEPEPEPAVEAPAADEAAEPQEEQGGKSFCYKCGNEIKTEHEFCAKCGAQKK